MKWTSWDLLANHSSTSLDSSMPSKREHAYPMPHDPQRLLLSRGCCTKVKYLFVRLYIFLFAFVYLY